MFKPELEVITLRQRVLELEKELADERARSNRSTDLMMAGEALRNKMMVQAILGGAFSPTLGT